MKFRIVLLVAMALCIIATAASSETAIRVPPDVILAVANAERLTEGWLQPAGTGGRSHDMSPFYAQLEILKKSQAANTDPTIRIVLAYYIGGVERVIVTNAMITLTKPDPVLGEDALRNFEMVLTNGRDMPEWGIRLSQANYDAGGTALALDGKADRAARYWAVCSAQGHAGCINNLAFELGKKVAATDDEIRQMIDLHAAVVSTGTRYQCAGEYSAVSEALLIHFSGIEARGVSDVALLDTAQTFYRQLQGSIPKPDPCGGSRIDLDQYMMRLDRGERRPDFLEDVRQKSSTPLWRQIAGYLQGTLNDAGLADAIASADGIGACHVHFYAAWKAGQDGRSDVARSHYEAMLKLKPDECTPEPLLMRRYLKLPPGEK